MKQKTEFGTKKKHWCALSCGVVVCCVCCVCLLCVCPRPPPPPQDHPKFRSFFPSPATIFILFLSLGVFSWNFGGVLVGRHLTCTCFRPQVVVWKPPAACRSAGGSQDNLRAQFLLSRQQVASFVPFPFFCPVAFFFCPFTRLLRWLDLLQLMRDDSGCPRGVLLMPRSLASACNSPRCSRKSQAAGLTSARFHIFVLPACFWMRVSPQRSFRQNVNHTNPLKAANNMSRMAKSNSRAWIVPHLHDPHVVFPPISGHGVQGQSWKKVSSPPTPTTSAQEMKQSIRFLPLCQVYIGKGLWQLPRFFPTTGRSSWQQGGEKRRLQSTSRLWQRNHRFFWERTCPLANNSPTRKNDT